MTGHTIDAPAGTIVIDTFFLEDLATAQRAPHMGLHNPNFDTYPIFAGASRPEDLPGSTFFWGWQSHWHPQYLAKWFSGKIYPDAFCEPQKAFVSANHFNFSAYEWYQLALSWNHTDRRARLHVNGILVGVEDQFAEDWHASQLNEPVSVGNSAMVFGRIAMFDSELDERSIERHYADSELPRNEATLRSLRRVYCGEGLPALNEHLDHSWEIAESLSLSSPDTLKHFYVQGCQNAVSIGREGMNVVTPREPPGHTNDEAEGRKHVYLWLDRFFEGEIHCSLEFQVLRRGGLSLLMLQSTGMQREDFMFDYPRRTTGTMRMVYGEDVRNYHWEFYREMNDTRNDVASCALLKNPYAWPLGFGTLSHPLETNTWHRVDFHQEGRSLRCAINGVQMIHAVDNPKANNGPVYRAGRIALRCMTRTEMRFRNLKVHTRAPFQTGHIGESARQPSCR